MTKANIAFTRMTCDRCGAVEEITAELARLYAWAHVMALHENGAGVLRADDAGRASPHLCPDCVAAFRNWWSVPPPGTTGPQRLPA